MKKTVLVEADHCDACGKQDYVTACLRCGTEHCWKCQATEGAKYARGVYASGSGDGYYCARCDAELTKDGRDGLHSAYRAVRSLQQECEAWSADFKRRREAAEARVESERRNVTQGKV